MNPSPPEPPSPFSVTFEPPTGMDSGWRFSCKEMFDVAGYPATSGHPRYGKRRGNRPTSRLLTHYQQAGATLIGKTLQSELAFSGLGENQHYGMPLNPGRPGCVTGGSSAGCAVAVATGAADFSIASDSAGSARIPAACCDVIGVSLTNQAQWFDDAVSLSPTFDQLGVLASNTTQLLRSLEPLLPTTHAPIPERVVVPAQLIATHCSSEVRDLFNEALARLRGLGIGIELSESDAFHEVERRQEERGVPVLAEIAASLASFLQERSNDVSPTIIERLEPYLTWGEAQIHALTEHVTAPLREFRRIHAEPILLPTLPVSPPPVGSRAVLGTLTKFANLLAESSISFPVPGLGLSVMLTTTDPATLLAVAELTTRDFTVSKSEVQG